MQAPMSKQERQDAADEWARQALDGLFDEISSGESEFNTYIHYMFAGFLRFFGPIWGDDPFDFLCRITLVAYALPDGGTAFKFAFIDDLIEDEDGGETETIWGGPGPGGDEGYGAGIPPHPGGDHAGEA